jgi:hypothetical protein
VFVGTSSASRDSEGVEARLVERNYADDQFVNPPVSLAVISLHSHRHPGYFTPRTCGRKRKRDGHERLELTI